VAVAVVMVAVVHKERLISIRVTEREMTTAWENSVWRLREIVLGFAIPLSTRRDDFFFISVIYIFFFHLKTFYNWKYYAQMWSYFIKFSH
jgi:hypothetical protein